MGEALGAGRLTLRDGDVLVVAQKIISKAEDARVALATLQPSPLALDWAGRWGRDPRMVELVLRESRRIVRMERGLIICSSAGTGS